MSTNDHKWFIEHTSPSTAHMFGVKDYLKSFRTRFQQVEIAESFFFGRILIIDGKIQSSELDEYIYHEALVHPAMLMHEAPRSVLVIGGGEGATLREVLLHPTVERAVMVDIDQEVVDLCKEYLQDWHRGSFDDPRTELLHLDARQYLEDHADRFDVIIGDLPEPVEAGPAQKLFTRQFYQLINRRLNEGGILALQAGDFSITFMDAHSAIYNTIKQAIAEVHSYRAYIPSFNTDWSYIVASKDKKPACLEPAEIDRRIRERGMQLKFYDGETHRGMFAVPRDLREKRDAKTTVIDDKNLISIY
ncbi:MAG: polyamine aminopropyltransferase [Bacillota bacterium]